MAPVKEPLEMRLISGAEQFLAWRSRLNSLGAHRYDSLLGKAVEAISCVKEQVAEDGSATLLQEQNALLERFAEVLETISDQISIIAGAEEMIPVASADGLELADTFEQMSAQMGHLERAYRRALASRNIREAAVIKALLAVYPDMLAHLEVESKVHLGLMEGSLPTLIEARQLFKSSKEELGGLGRALLANRQSAALLGTGNLGEMIMSQLENDNLIDQYPYLAAMHPAHLLFMRHLPFNSLDYFLDLLKKMDTEKRAALMPTLYTHVGLCDKDGLGGLVFKQDSPEAFEAFCAHCREGSALIFDRLLITGLVQVALDYLFHLGDTTGVEATRARVREAIDGTHKKIDEISGHAAAEYLPDEWMENHLSQLPEQTARFRALYVYFCETVLQKLYEENWRPRALSKPQSEGARQVSI
jgi:hypothetical protein